jgi:hypothetical protein
VVVADRLGELAHGPVLLVFRAWRWLAQPDELGVRVHEARSRLAALVDEGVDVPETLCRCIGHAREPGGCDRLDLAVLELGERAHVPRAVDHHFLALEGWIEVRHHAHLPTGRVGRLARGQRQRLGRRAVLAPFAERTALELRLGGVLDHGHPDARPARAARCDDDLTAGHGIDSELAGHGGAL